jgi:hypothetical protein
VAPESGDTALTGRGPSGRLDIGDEAAAEPAADDAEVDEPAAGTARVIRRGHLTLIAG